MIIHQTTNSEASAYNLRFYEDIFWAPHFHRSFEFILVLEGEVSFTIGERTELLTADGCALCLQNEVHSYKSVGHSRSAVIVFAPGYVPSFSSRVGDRRGDRLSFRLDRSVLEYVKECILHEGELDILRLKSCLYAICSEYLSKVRLTEYEEREGDRLLGKITDHLSKNYMNNITLRSLSEALSYNYSYLSRNFKRIFGMSFSDTVNLYRIENAMRLLEDPEVKITTVALECGFQSVRNFNAVFKEKTGLTPGEYRRSRRH